ncbi:peptidyl-prolyl cis-trans isomerase FKBP16-3, chloroplastic isoform X2 [Cryptomeria japonica]|uniref:peptidyl-prolyl cis-trans isomerase FKBP16-3, chloroplastic isoform X2 n=1 Tax=Cryptomeria japonica TaxID=3369 RepID=UPI0025AD4C5E|nr:peptidyl-prolyl cis-trans isomerase FKBP16-3, chloroplastic isoform X2 [Cryptomeria japonica]
MAMAASIIPLGLVYEMKFKRLRKTTLQKTRQYLVGLCLDSEPRYKKIIAQSCYADANAGIIDRRYAIRFIGLTAGHFFNLSLMHDARGAGLPPEEKAKLCDATCEKELENAPMVTTESGLQYKDIKDGVGPSPPVGFQVAANYVAMVPSGQVFDSSLEKGQPYIFRVGSGQVIKGLDEGILSMKVGGKRRLYIPGPLAFPKGLSSAAGRPRVPPSSPVIFDVSLEFIPGLDDEEE